MQDGHEKNLVGDVARGAGDDYTRVVERANYMLSEGLMTHGGSTSLRGSEKEFAKDTQMSERNFVTGLRTCL